MNDEATLRRNIEVWVAQYRDHDAAALAAWYTKDSVYITPTGLMLVGPEQVRQYFDASFKRSPAMGIEVKVDEIRVEKPGLAIGRGTFEVTKAVDPTGKPLPLKGPWVTTFVMRGERWIPLTHASAITVEAYVPVRT